MMSQGLYKIAKQRDILATVGVQRPEEGTQGSPVLCFGQATTYILCSFLHFKTICRRNMEKLEEENLAEENNLRKQDH